MTWNQWIPLFSSDLVLLLSEICLLSRACLNKSPNFNSGVGKLKSHGLLLCSIQLSLAQSGVGEHGCVAAEGGEDEVWVII